MGVFLLLVNGFSELFLFMVYGIPPLRIYTTKVLLDHRVGLDLRILILLTCCGLEVEGTTRSSDAT